MGKKYFYQIIEGNPESVNEALNKAYADGWEVAGDAQVKPSNTWHTGGLLVVPIRISIEAAKKL